MSHVSVTAVHFLLSPKIQYSSRNVVDLNFKSPSQIKFLPLLPGLFLCGVIQFRFAAFNKARASFVQLCGYVVTSYPSASAAPAGNQLAQRH